MARRQLLLLAGLLGAALPAWAADPPPDRGAAIAQSFVAEKSAVEGAATALLRSEQHLDEIARALMSEYLSERTGCEARLQTAMEWLKDAQAKERHDDQH